MSTSEVPATSTVIPIHDAAEESQTKALVPPPAPVPPATRFAAMFRKTRAAGGSRRGIAVFDFLLRLLTLGATIAAAISMGTASETLPFYTEDYQFRAIYYDFPQLIFFVVANAFAAAYLVLSLPFSLIAICRPKAVCPRILLFVFDAVMVALTSAAAAAATAIVYLAHEGNSSANWVAICIRFQDFCQQTSGGVIASFVAVVFFIVLVLISGVALRRC